MLRFFSALLVACVALSAEAQTALSDLPLGDAAAFEAGSHIIVTAKVPAGQTDTDWAEDLARANDMSVVAIWPLRSIDIMCFVFVTSGDASTIASTILQRAEVDAAYPVQTFETLSAVRYPDRYAQLQDGFSDMQVWSAHRVTRGDGVVIALIDTAVETRHGDLVNQNVTTRNFVSRDGIDALGEVHGTAMAAIIAADAANGEGMVGMAPDAALLALRACWEESGDGKGRCNTFSLARAVNFAILNNADVINLSLTGPSDPILYQLLAAALRRNISVVMAHPPQSADGMGRDLPGVVFASQRAQAGAVVAPGREVLSAKPVDDYDFFSGSSVAAAHVSGALALLRSASPAASVGDLSAAISARSAAQNRVVDLCAALRTLGTTRGACN